MSRFIDAEPFDCISWKGIPEGYDDTFDSGVLYVADLIDDQPVICTDELQGVVHCCHCRHAEPRDPVGQKTEIFCRLFCAGMREHDYCSRGKLRTNSVPWMEASDDE